VGHLNKGAEIFTVGNLTVGHENPSCAFFMQGSPGPTHFPRALHQEYPAPVRQPCVSVLPPTFTCGEIEGVAGTAGMFVGNEEEGMPVVAGTISPLFVSRSLSLPLA